MLVFFRKAFLLSLLFLMVAMLIFVELNPVRRASPFCGIA